MIRLHLLPHLTPISLPWPLNSLPYFNHQPPSHLPTPLITLSTSHPILFRLMFVLCGSPIFRSKRLRLKWPSCFNMALSNPSLVLFLPLCYWLKSEMEPGAFAWTTEHWTRSLSKIVFQSQQLMNCLTNWEEHAGFPNWICFKDIIKYWCRRRMWAKQNLELIMDIMSF